MKENLALTSDGQQNNTPILTQPKVSKTDKLHELVENLPPEKRALIALRLKKKKVRRLLKIRQFLKLSEREMLILFLFLLHNKDCGFSTSLSRIV